MTVNLTPKVNCEYGAPMGRTSAHPHGHDFDGKLYLHRIRLDSGGYDSGGAYWGVGKPLYGYADEDMEYKGFVRA